jgi:hypothetical protein
MLRGLVNLVAKQASPTIVPPSSFEPIRRPHPILNDQPSEQFAFGRRPLLPNTLWHGRGGKSQKLRRIRHLGGVAPIPRKLPYNRVRQRRG